MAVSLQVPTLRCLPSPGQPTAPGSRIPAVLVVPWLLGAIAALPAVVNAQTGPRGQGMCGPGYFQQDGIGWSNCVPIPDAARGAPRQTPSQGPGWLRQFGDSLLRRPSVPPTPLPRSTAQENDWVSGFRAAAGKGGTPGCQPGMARCWYAFWGTGAAPYRRLYFVDMNGRAPASPQDPVALDVVTAYEGNDPRARVANDHSLLTVEIRCRQNQIRITDGYAVLANGRTERLNSVTPWLPFQAAWHERAARAACEAGVRQRPGDHLLLWFGSMPSPAEVTAATRQTLWRQPLR